MRAPPHATFPVAPNVVLARTTRYSTYERRSVGAAVTWDALTPEWTLCQLAAGHRFSNDDSLCAFYAAEARPDARRLLDLGAGVGSVGLSTLWRLDERATLRCVEAQAVSHELCRRTVAANGLDDRVSLERGDLRDFDGLRGYDVVTGSPPYIDPRKGVPSRHDQKAFCRLEFRGGLDDYLAAAARALAPGGAFAYVMAAADDRNDVCPPRHGLVVTRRVDVVFKLGRKPHICICVCERAADDATPAAERETLVLRDADGRRTRDYRARPGERRSSWP